MRFCDDLIEVVYNHIEGIVKVEVIGDDDVGLVFERLDILLKGGGDVVFVAVEYIVEVIAALFFVADDAALELDVVLGVNEELKVKLLYNFCVVEDKEAFHDQYGSRLEDEFFGSNIGIVKGILRFCYFFAAAEGGDITRKALVVDALWCVKIGYTVAIDRLLVTGQVVVVLRDEADVVLVKRIEQAIEETGFPRGAAACDADDVRLLHGRKTNEFRRLWKNCVCFFEFRSVYGGSPAALPWLCPGGRWHFCLRQTSLQK